MSEKLKPNFTPVPNVVFDTMMREIASGSLRVLLAICRYTYGWGKPSDRISLGQLAEMTGMNRSNVHRAVKQLDPLLIVTPGDPRTNRASEYRINVDVSDSDLVSPRQQDLVSPRQQPVVTAQLSKERRLREDTHAQRRETVFTIAKRKKRSPPDAAALEAFGRFYAAYPRRVGKEDSLKAWTRLEPGSELVAEIMAGVERYAEAVKDTDPKFIKHPGPWLNARRWEDEPVNGNGAGTTKPEIKDLGDGFFEVEGRRMDRQTLERRYGTKG